MPWFEYEGLTPGSTPIRGRVEAKDHEQAAAELAEMRIDVRDLSVAPEAPARPLKISADDLIGFNEHLASLSKAGIALDEGLAQLAKDVESPSMRRWIESLAEDTRRGIPLDEAFAARESNLPVLYSNVLRAGIRSGNLHDTLLNLNQHLKLISRTRRILWETASYPILVGVLAILVMSCFFVLVMPRFIEIFQDFGVALPGLTRALMAFTGSYVETLTLAAVVLIAGFVFFRVIRTSPKGRLLRENLIMLIPVIGRIYRDSLITRFLRSMSSLIGTGTTLPEALRLGAGATGSETLARESEQLAQQVERGESIYATNQLMRIIPPLFGYCVEVSGEQNLLAESVASLSNTYESRAQHGQTMLQTLVFPIMIIALGGFLAFCILGTFLPLVSLINSMCG